MDDRAVKMQFAWLRFVLPWRVFSEALEAYLLLSVVQPIGLYETAW
jgi:hypothetical protein